MYARIFCTLHWKRPCVRLQQGKPDERLLFSSRPHSTSTRWRLPKLCHPERTRISYHAALTDGHVCGFP